MTLSKTCMGFFGYTCMMQGFLRLVAIYIRTTFGLVIPAPGDIERPL